MGKKLAIGAGVLALVAMVVVPMVRDGKGKGVEVDFATVETGSIEAVVKARGQVDPRVKVDVSAHVIARIEKLYVVEGQEIQVGAPFLELERDAFVAARDSAAAQLAIARSRVDGAKLDLADAERELLRAADLVRDGVTPADEEVRRRFVRDAARLSLDQAHEAVRQARAALVKAEDDLTKTTILAPLTGRVVALSAEEGEVVVSGTMNNPASVIGTIADLSEILVEVGVDENDIVRVALDQVASVQVDALVDTKLTGRVVEIGSSGFEKPSQPDVTFFTVKILLEAPPQTLRPGMSARAEITTERREDAVVIPIGAIASRPSEADDKVERDVVFVEKDGVVALREVEVGITDELNAAIEKGLEAGERIVTGPYRALKELDDGELVRQRERKAKKDDKDKADEDSDDESEE